MGLNYGVFKATILGKNSYTLIDANLLDSASKIAQEVVRSEVIECDKNYTWHEKGMRAAQAAGLGGLVVPEKYGGLEQGLAGLAKVCEAFGQESASMGICFGMHAVGSAVIAAQANEYQVENYLKPICAGNHLTTLTLSEPGTGAHFYYPETQLITTDKGFMLEGIKTFTTNGGHADSYVVSAVNTASNNALAQFSCVLVDNHAEGLQWEGKWEGVGMRGNSSITAKLNKVAINKSNLLGNEGDEIWYIFNVVAPYFLMAMAGTYLGVAAAAFNEAKEHLKSRSHSHTGKALSSNGIQQYKLGELWARLEKHRQYIYWAASYADGGGEMSIPALCSAKAEIAGCATSIVNDAMTMCGGKGYAKGSKLERLLRDARAADVMSPTTDLLRLWTGRFLLDKPLLD